MYVSRVNPRQLLHVVTVAALTRLNRSGAAALHVEYAKQRIKYGILFIFSPLYEYSKLEYGG